MAKLPAQPIAGATAPPRDTADRCAACGAPMAGDQRYCLECGERRAPVSEFLRSGPPRASSSPPAAPPASRPGYEAAAPPPSRAGTPTLLAGIGVLLLAMGVGVLIGRSAPGSGRTAAPEVVTVGSAGAAATAGKPAETFTGEWPAGRKGFTIELQTLPSSSTPAAVAAAKSAAEARGAKSVGALKAEEFPTVGGEGFVVYSGVYSSRSTAGRSLAAVKKSFPAAKVVEVSSGAGTSAGGKASSSGGGVKAQTGTPPTEKTFKAPPKLSSSSGRSHGKKAVEESAKLPDVVETP